jgi:hypothetical protein
MDRSTASMATRNLKRKIQINEMRDLGRGCLSGFAGIAAPREPPPGVCSQQLCDDFARGLLCVSGNGRPCGADTTYSMLKFFALDARLRGVVAASTGGTPVSAFAPSIFVGPLGQLPPSLSGISPCTAVGTPVLCSIMSLTN